MEIAQSEQTSLELIGSFVAFIDERLVEIGISSSQVRLQVLRGLVRDFD